MMHTRIRRGIVIFLLAILPVTLTFHGCGKSVEDIIDDILKILTQTGWLAEDENMDNIPEDITPFDDGGTLAARVSLEDKFPPIGNQGNYGTCVAWSVGYNLKTALNAIEKGWSSSELGNASNQTSPKDLWLTIPSGQKGSNCEGTNFEPALDALITDGAASLSAVPYSSMGNCTGSKTGNSGNKLANYRKIASETEGLTVGNFKGYLNAGRPIAFGARLGDRFMTWNSSAVISSDTYNNPGMQHAYHAMVLVGYDDSKNAFRVRNSWGTSWGDNGSIWIDYDFFCKSFCFAAFVAQNVNSVSVGSGGISSGNLSNGYDLLAYHAEDEADNSDPNYDRAFSYKVYNSGNKTILPTSNWTVVYMLYDAMNANNYQVIFDDYYSASACPDCDEDGYNNDSKSLVGGYWNNAKVEPGKMAGEEEYGTEGFVISYKMPNLTGKYYLVVMADAYDVIKEVNEDNNFYFITAENGKPLEFQNGKISNMSPKSAMNRSTVKRPAPFSNTENQTLVKPGNLNTYTPDELKTMLIHDKNTGKLDAKIKAFRTVEEHNFVKRSKKQ
ncbi:MAG: C1 family peptidase [Bacteroidales bacterium]|jgi:hypothetical protein|nr:C1 family peptidase [Bacteroidales bacterium]